MRGRERIERPRERKEVEREIFGENERK